MCIELKELVFIYFKFVVAVIFSGFCYGLVNVIVIYNIVGDILILNIYIG